MKQRMLKASNRYGIYIFAVVSTLKERSMHACFPSLSI